MFRWGLCDEQEVVEGKAAVHNQFFLQIFFKKNNILLYIFWDRRINVIFCSQQMNRIQLNRPRPSSGSSKETQGSLRFIPERRTRSPLLSCMFWTKKTFHRRPSPLNLTKSAQPYKIWSPQGASALPPRRGFIFFVRSVCSFPAEAPAL